jgi:hypothetical protein
VEGTECLLKYLAKSSVVVVERIKTNDKKRNLNESGLHIPEEIKVDYMKYNVRTRYPGPMKCVKCKKFGNIKARCSSTMEICRGCGIEKHDGQCERKKCIHCKPPNDNHPNFDSKCPEMVYKKDICKMKGMGFFFYFWSFANFFHFSDEKQPCEHELNNFYFFFINLAK